MARNKIQRAQTVHTGAAKPNEVPPSMENPNPHLGSGRNTIVERAIDPLGENKLTPSPIKGGTYGVIPEAEKRVSFHAGTTMRRDAVAARKPKTFVILGPLNAAGRISFVYDHQRVSVARGKEVTEQTYDLDLLRAQGLHLEEVIDPLEEARQAQLSVVEQSLSDDGSGEESTDEDGDGEDEDKE